MSMTDLIAALAEANGKVPAPKKTKTNPHFRSKYADVADVEAAVRPVWAEHGLAWRYHIANDQHGLTVALVVLHTSGETLHLPGLTVVPPANPQQLISVTTYYKRLVLSAAAGVSADDDDDGNQAAGRDEPHEKGAAAPSSHPAAKAPPPSRGGSSRPAHDLAKRGPQGDNPMTDAQRRRLWATARAKGYGAKPELAAYAAGILGWDEYDEARLSAMTKAEASRLIDALQDVELAEREQPSEPPPDPWADTEQGALA